MKADLGSLVRGLTLRTDGEINADCFPEITTNAKMKLEKVEKEEKEAKREKSISQASFI